MKVENLVRNYKMVYSDRKDEEEIKVLKGLDFTCLLYTSPSPRDTR